MIFQSLEFDNFESYGEGNKVPLENQGLVLIEGDNQDDPTVESNGAGKSGIFDALTWGLFGNTLRGLKADAVVHRKIKKDCLVQVYFTDEAGHEYGVKRYRQHSRSVPVNALELFRGNKRLTQTDADATQKKILEIIGMDFETFHHSVMFGQGFVNQFAALKDKGQKEVIEKLIGMETISHASVRARAKRADVESDIYNENNILANWDTKEINRDIEGMKTERRNWSETRDAEVKELEEKIVKRGAINPATYRKRMRTTQARMKETKEALEKAQKRRRDAEKEEDSLASEVGRFRLEIERIDESIQNVNEAKLGESCTACGQEIDAHAKGEYVAHLQKLKVAAQASLKRMQKNAEAQMELTQEIRVKYGEATRAAEEAEKEFRKAESQMFFVDDVEKEIEELKTKKKRLLNSTWLGQNRLDKLLTKREKAKSATAEGKAKISKWEDEMKYLTFIETMLSDRGASDQPPLKGLLMDSVTPFLNKKASYYSRILTGGSISVEFNTQSQLKTGQFRDRFEVVASNRYGADVYAGNSGGEKRKIDVCVALALQALSASRGARQINVAFFDEVFESLDETACDSVMELLVAERERYSSLFVITHQEGLKAYFPKTIRVVKRNGISTIVEK